MVCRFGGFELDESRRELRFEGREIPLQPRVFDLLAVLYRNRHRVMSKDELMAELWPDVIVTEGSLQRAVSLARSALRQGDMANAIRNYVRQGYRFCDDDATGEKVATADDPLAAAEAASGRGDWDAAVAAYRRADEIRALDAGSLERLADACQCSGRAAESEPVLERAVAAYSARGDQRGAARAALRLAEIAFEGARRPVAQGWLARGRHFLESCDEGWEHGFEAYISARFAVAVGDPDQAIEHATRGLETGERLGDEDMQALNRLYLGFGEISVGNIERGTALVDEAAAAALSGAAGLRTGGLIYCGFIWVCCNLGDWQRASQWSDSFTRWCARGGMTRFSGLCQLHRAEVLSVSGQAQEAEREIRVACDQLESYSPYALGDAHRILGDLHLLRGNLEQAEAAYRTAHELGWDPQPGLALLQAERGNAQNAIRTLLRSLDDRGWALRQRRGLLLAVLAIIASQYGDRDTTRFAMQELDRHPDLWSSEFHGGAVARARAEFAVLEGDTGEAVSAMRNAIRGWQTARAGLNLAICRLRLAELLADQGDVPGALLELDAAERIFAAASAPSRVEACATLRAQLSPG